MQHLQGNISGSARLSLAKLVKKTFLNCFLYKNGSTNHSKIGLLMRIFPCFFLNSFSDEFKKDLFFRGGGEGDESN